MLYLIDVYSWIEYLEGSKEGEKVYEILKSNNEIFVLPITISEVVSKVKRMKGNALLAYEAIVSNSQIIETTPKIAKEAGLLHAQIRKKQPSFGIVDALLITTAKFIKGKVLTGDRHFRNFKETVFVR